MHVVTVSDQCSSHNRRHQRSNGCYLHETSHENVTCAVDEQNIDSVKKQSSSNMSSLPSTSAFYSPHSWIMYLSSSSITNSPPCTARRASSMTCMRRRGSITAPSLRLKSTQSERRLQSPNQSQMHEMHSGLDTNYPSVLAAPTELSRRGQRAHSGHSRVKNDFSTCIPPVIEPLPKSTDLEPVSRLSSAEALSLPATNIYTPLLTKDCYPALLPLSASTTSVISDLGNKQINGSAMIGNSSSNSVAQRCNSSSELLPPPPLVAKSDQQLEASQLLGQTVEFQSNLIDNAVNKEQQANLCNAKITVEDGRIQQDSPPSKHQRNESLSSSLYQSKGLRKISSYPSVVIVNIPTELAHRNVRSSQDSSQPSDVTTTFDDVSEVTQADFEENICSNDVFSGTLIEKPDECVSMSGYGEEKDDEVDTKTDFNKPCTSCLTNEDTVKDSNPHANKSSILLFNSYNRLSRITHDDTWGITTATLDDDDDHPSSYNPYRGSIIHLTGNTRKKNTVNNSSNGTTKTTCNRSRKSSSALIEMDNSKDMNLVPSLKTEPSSTFNATSLNQSGTALSLESAFQKVLEKDPEKRLASLSHDRSAIPLDSCQSMEATRNQSVEDRGRSAHFNDHSDTIFIPKPLLVSKDTSRASTMATVATQTSWTTVTRSKSNLSTSTQE